MAVTTWEGAEVCPRAKLFPGAGENVHLSPCKSRSEMFLFVLPLSQAAASQGVFHPTVLPPSVVVTKVSPASPAETYPKGNEAQRGPIFVFWGKRREMVPQQVVLGKKGVI